MSTTTTRSVLLLVVVGLLLFFCIHTTNGEVIEFDDVAREQEYDYIVVGVGASGGVAASRLAEAGHQVLGIDGGKRSVSVLGGTDYVAAKFSYDRWGNIVYDTPYTRFDVPIFYPSTYQPPTPWETYPAYYNGVLGGGKHPGAGTNVGRNLGGSGAHNSMQWVRFTKPAFDSWGVRGWYYDDVLHFYKKSENVTGTSTEGSTYYHGLKGPIHLTDTPTGQYYESVNQFIDACVNTGLPRNPDFNGARRLGCGASVYNIRRGVRDSSVNAYVPKAVRGGNLHLSLESFVTKVIIKRERDGSLRAVGVEYKQFGQTKQVYARKEVVLTLGAILTPKLLLLSGIGPAAELTALGIPVLVNNPNVGKNLSNNHITIGGAWAYPKGNLPNGFRVSDDATSYALNGTGPWAFPAMFGVAYACSGLPCNPQNPDIHAIVTAGLFDFEGDNTLTITVETTTPKGTGSVTLTSADPEAPPNITVAVFQNAADLASVVGGLKLFRSILAQPPANVNFGPEITPGPTVVTDAQLTAWARNNTSLAGHWRGSARVGNIGDPSAVLDPQMRVLGVKGLRVGDVSVIVVGNGHTHASAIMVGERVADFIINGPYI